MPQLDKTNTLIPYKFSKNNGVIVSKIKNTIQVKSLKNTSLEVISELSIFFNKPLSISWIDKQDFERALSSLYDDTAESSSDLIEGIDEEYDLNSLVEGLPKTSDLQNDNDDAPVIKLINAVLSEAIKSNASDVHIEPYEEYISIRFRIDGILKEILKPNSRLSSMLNARIKVMSNLDIAEKRIPQDGRMSLKLGEKWIDIRVSTLPSSHGERVVLRILDKADTQIGLKQLGINNRSLDKLERILKNPNGIILVTGPTGSGKTTTLYAALNILNDQSRNILTVEDPIEYAVDGVGQTQVNNKIGMTFAKGLRAILRQDPDIVMVGEIRDLETAEIAVQASLTGHLVLSTIHTNDAVSALTRLKDMGIEPYLLSSTLKGVLAQRLVRKLCNECKVKITTKENTLDFITGSEVYESLGCSFCNKTGYSGRIGIFELLLVDDVIKDHITQGTSESELKKLAFSDMPVLSSSGKELVLKGITSIDEILRVTREQ